MSALEENVYQAIETIASTMLSELKFDQTIRTTIIKIVDADTGEYLVNYNGNTFSAFAADPSIAYKVKDEVFVNVPQGELSDRKLIMSKVTNLSLTAAEKMQLANKQIDISPTFEGFYEYSTDKFGVCAGAPFSVSLDNPPHSENYVFEPASYKTYEDAHARFKLYANEYDTIRVSASFMTQFYGTHTEGNYGLDITFWCATTDTAKMLRSSVR